MQVLPSRPPLRDRPELALLPGEIVGETQIHPAILLCLRRYCRYPYFHFEASGRCM